MAVATTIYAQTVTWNSNTWNSTSGGPIMAEYVHAGEPLEDRTGDALYPPFVAIVNGRCEVRIRLREIKDVTALGTKSNLAITATGKSNTVTVTCAGMVLVGVDPGSQSRAEGGSRTMIFRHESADGTTVPVS